MLDKKILYIGRSLRPYRRSFLRELSQIGSLHVRIEDGLQHVPSECAQSSAEYTNFVLRDTEGYNSRWPNVYISFGLLKELYAKKFDYVILEGTSGSLFLAALICKFKRSKIIISYERTLHTERNASALKKLFHSFYFKYVSDGVLSNGKSTNKYLKSIGREYSIYSRNVFPGSFKGTRLESDVMKFLFVGQLIERKGVAYLLDFIEFLKSKESQLTIVGDGPLKDDILHSIRDVSNVTFIERLDYEAVISQMRSHDYLFMPTLEDNWSLVALEATLNGCVPITTKYNGLTGDLLVAKNSVIYDFTPEFWPKNYDSITDHRSWSVKSHAGISLNKLDIYSDLDSYLSSL